jgi:tricorn protease
MVAELSALHTFVRGGDLRDGSDRIAPATLGANLVRDEAAGGWRVDHVFRNDPDQPELRSPLAEPTVNVKAGDVITRLNGRDAMEVPDVSMILRHQAGKQVLLSVKSRTAAGDYSEPREVVVTPISMEADSERRYHEWEYTRRLGVEAEGNGELGYVHIRAMGKANFAEFARGFYPVFNRKGLIIDVRHNRGGNIDSWLLSRLMRKAWFYWQPRVGEPYWNMQYAFRGHIVVLCNERTASDGEAFAEGIKRLKLGTVIGTRTWGGEIWLSSSNVLVDKGIATAAESGVYGPDGIWLIEGHGVEPDIVVDNPPHATFNGEDAQLDAAIEFLKRKIAAEPVEVPKAPRHPDKSFKPVP